jgi:hypothetical protein
MATLKEQAFISAVSTAQGVRQGAIAAAFAANAVNGAIPPANIAAYQSALEAADGAWWTSIVSAGSTNGVSPHAVNGNPGVFGGSTAAILT